MSLRAWEVRDLDAIAAMEEECFSDPWNRRMLAESLLAENFFGVLLEEDGIVVGYGGIGIAYEDAEIQLIAVSEMYRRCGRGKLIVEELVKIAKEHGAKHIFLEVRVSNASAQMLYLKCGFTGLYARSRYYSDGEDAIVMRKELS